MKELLRAHKRPIAAAAAAGGGAGFLVGFGLGLTAAAVVGGFYLLERARNRREELTR